MNNKKKYDWNFIQSEYDRGLTFRELRAKYGVCFESFQNAKKRGDFISRSISEAKYLADIKSPRVHSMETKNKLSKIVKNKIDNGTWHTSLAKHMHINYNGNDLHGTWEVKYAQYLDANNIKWIRNKESFPYVFENTTRKYIPDFYLIETDEYVEIKGYKTKKDKAKWTQFPKKLRTLMKDELRNLGIDV